MNCQACGCEGNGMRCEVCGDIKCGALDRIVNATTAFNSLSELETAIKDTGYVPTVYATTNAKRTLIRVLKARGYAVWGNKGKNW